MTFREIQTPALAVINDRMEYNLDKMSSFFKDSRKTKLRPHYKSHKCADIARMQIERGACGITCSKLSEAQDLASNGICDILIANEIVQPQKLFELALLARTTKLTVCVDCESNIKALSAAASATLSVVGCYIEFDLGMDRCGVKEFGEVYRLVCLVQSSPALEYRGIQAYSGNLSHEFDRARRESGFVTNRERLTGLVYYLEQRGIKTAEISGESTGTYYLNDDSTVFTEIQAGSYVFMDRNYSKMDLDFRNSLFVISTVVSSSDGKFVLDAGLKSISSDQGYPMVCGWDYDRAEFSEEHITFFGDHSYKTGDTVLLLPGHCCTTVNLYDEMYRIQGERVLGKMRITSRGKSR